MILIELGRYFALLSRLTFGGVSSVIPEMQRYIVDVKGWTTAADFLHLFAVAQAAPGPNVLFTSLIGYKVAGLAGSLVALLGLCVPAAALTLVGPGASARTSTSGRSAAGASAGSCRVSRWSPP